LRSEEIGDPYPDSLQRDGGDPARGSTPTNVSSLLGRGSEMAQGDRAAKVADRIKEVIAKRLEKGLRDPRVGFVTITDVRVTGDLQHASVFYTVYGTDEARAATAAGHTAACGMLLPPVCTHHDYHPDLSLRLIADTT